MRDRDTSAKPIDFADAASARRVLERRAAAEHVLAMAQHMGHRERVLLEQIYRHGLSITDVARLMNVRPRTLQREVRCLLNRIADPEFGFVVAGQELLPRDVRQVARLVILEGRALRDAAKRTGLTLHRVRCHLATIRAFAEARRRQFDLAG
ncbi:helix-turn-helix domain-containing protein [Phycisphaerales bacterium AB-hyl4]|uniref:Helix-turn-helix domain-containing protein n=1 Tax=Natronomicrosphaera hydrolytica TaxID=3242702 RepID=A0ABV4U4K6_9BACT